jgi:uroporphyrinogen III methyltransferase/synthase
LVARLSELGARVVEAPVIEIVDPPDDGDALGAAVAGIDGYDWVVFTSPNGVHRTFARIPDTRVLGGVEVAAIGPGTAEALARYRVVPDLMPEAFVAESLLHAFPQPPPGGGRVLLARAAQARDVLPDGLAAHGWTVEVVAAYQTVATVPSPDLVDQVAAADAVTFTSSSTVANFCDRFGTERVPPVVVSIGPITSATARDRGLSVDAEADPHTIDGLVDAVLDALGRGPAGASA